MDDSSVAKRLVKAIIADFPDHADGRRPIHTIGIGVKGHFVASDVARSYCIAEHFQGQPVEVSVRFSNGSGSPARHDGWSDVRGMATRFHLSDGRATDLIAMTLGEFFVRTIDEFFEFTKDAQQTVVEREKPWRKFLDMLRLKPPMPDPPPGKTKSGDLGTLVYANRHRFAQLGVFQAASIGAPVSYVRASYHAVHTFFVKAPDGIRRPVRFSWQPVAGVRTTDPTLPPVDNYLQEELAERLTKWPARMMLMMTIGEAGDALDDPTQHWPSHRVRVVMGTLTLTEVAKGNEQVALGEHISFNPMLLTDGIEPSGDPILRAREDAYKASSELRNGTPCPFHRS